MDYIPVKGNTLSTCMQKWDENLNSHVKGSRIENWKLFHKVVTDKNISNEDVCRFMAEKKIVVSGRMMTDTLILGNNKSVVISKLLEDHRKLDKKTLEASISKISASALPAQPSRQLPPTPQIANQNSSTIGMPKPTKVGTTTPVATTKQKPVAKPYDAKTFGLNAVQGPGFPDVDPTIKDQVRLETLSTLDKWGMNIDQPTNLTTSGKALISTYGHAVKFYPGKIQGKKFINPGDVVQTPMLMTHDEKFQPMKATNAFYMHSTPAPNAKSCNAIDPTNRPKYLKEMKDTVKSGLEAQIASGSKHVLWNYFGMGAFLRDKNASREDMYHLRQDITRVIVEAFDEVMTKVGAKGKDVKFYLTGPTGESFTADKEEEPKDNYNAFVLAFANSAFKNNVQLCPETDAFVLAQQLADKHKLKPGQIAPVSVMNAADPYLLGNHWFDGFKNGRFNANYAIDENGHRRSPMAGAFAKEINGGKKAQGNCKANIDAIHKMV